MFLQCPVCDNTFKRVQDCAAHIRLKKDSPHRQFLLTQEREITRQFSETLQTATTSMRQPVLEVPTVLTNDVDQGDLPSSRSMDVDDDANSDDEEEVGINSEPERVIADDDDSDDEDHLTNAMQAAACALGDVNLDDILEVLDFLPDPELEDLAGGEAGPGPSTSANRRMRRTLIDDDAELPTFQWHPTAGREYKQEETVHARWRSLFGGDDADPEFKPFSSRLDWEIAHWALKEKISQKSFNRLLTIPQVNFNSSKHQPVLMKKPN